MTHPPLVAAGERPTPYQHLIRAACAGRADIKRRENDVMGFAGIVLNSFGVGVGFAVGVCVGAFICQMVTKTGRDEMSNELRAHWHRLEGHAERMLDRYTRMAVAMETIERRVADATQGKPWSDGSDERMETAKAER